MSQDILTSFTLSFKDQSLKHLHSREKTYFFNKVNPVITFVLLALTVSLELIYRGEEGAAPPVYITAINIFSVVLLLFVSILHKRLPMVNKVVCPLLTVLIFIHLSFLDYDFTISSIYFS